MLSYAKCLLAVALFLMDRCEIGLTLSKKEKFAKIQIAYVSRVAYRNTVLMWHRCLNDLYLPNGIAMWSSVPYFGAT